MKTIAITIAITIAAHAAVGALMSSNVVKAQKEHKEAIEIAMVQRQWKR